jgi:hypothetical protein
MNKWYGQAMDPVTKLLLALEVGERTLAMAQCLVHQVTQLLALDCAPLFLTDGFRDYLIALVTHYDRWMPPEQCQAKASTLRTGSGVSGSSSSRSTDDGMMTWVYRVGRSISC